MEMEKPDSLRVLRTEPIGLLGVKYYAADTKGNVWVCIETNGKSGEWRLHKTAAEVAAQQPSLSFEQIIKLNSEQ